MAPENDNLREKKTWSIISLITTTPIPTDQHILSQCVTFCQPVFFVCEFPEADNKIELNQTSLLTVITTTE